jgi:DNA repair protein RadC
VNPYYDLGERRRRTRVKEEECGCHEPVRARTLAEKLTPSERRGSYPASKTEPIILSAGKGSKCGPFLVIQKDAKKFAACNALANKIGPINTPQKAFKLIGDALGAEVNEVFGLITLDLHLRMKSIAETGRGEPAAVMAPMVPTLQAALIDGAHAVVLFHCHPSGIPAEPSDADKETTEAFVDAFDQVGVVLLDHVIVGGSLTDPSWFSFAEDGLLPSYDDAE